MGSFDKEKKQTLFFLFSPSLLLSHPSGSRCSDPKYPPSPSLPIVNARPVEPQPIINHKPSLRTCHLLVQIEFGFMTWKIGFLDGYPYQNPIFQVMKPNSFKLWDLWVSWDLYKPIFLFVLLQICFSGDLVRDNEVVTSSASAWATSTLWLPSSVIRPHGDPALLYHLSVWSFSHQVLQQQYLRWPTITGWVRVEIKEEGEGKREEKREKKKSGSGELGRVGECWEREEKEKEKKEKKKKGKMKQWPGVVERVSGEWVQL